MPKLKELHLYYLESRPSKVVILVKLRDAIIIPFIVIGVQRIRRFLSQTSCDA